MTNLDSVLESRDVTVPTKVSIVKAMLFPVVMYGASLVAHMVKNLPAFQGIQVRSLGQKDLLEKGVKIHSIILAWRIPWTEELGRLLSMESQKVGHN